MLAGSSSDGEITLLQPAPRPRAAVSIAWVVVALIAVQASFGGNAVITKVALTKQADPVVFSFLRDVGGAFILLLACKVRGCLVWPRRADLGTFILLGVLGVYIGQQFIVLALQYVDPLNAAVLQPSQPVLTTLLAAIFGVEPLQLRTLHGRLKLCGVLLAAAGAVCTVYWAAAAGDDNNSGRRLAGGHAHHHHTSIGGGGGEPPPSAPSTSPSAPRLILGNALLVIQCVSGALYQLLQKHLLSTADYPPLAVAAMGYVVGAVSVGLVLPVCKLEPEHWAFLGDRTALLALGYAIVFTSALNYGLQAFANKHSSPTLVTAFFPMQIVFTALFSWIFLGNVPRGSDYAGAAMIVAGLAGVTAGRVLHARQLNKLVVEAAERDV